MTEQTDVTQPNIQDNTPQSGVEEISQEQMLAAKRIGELRQQEAEANSLPSQRILQYQMEMVAQRGEAMCQDLARKKLEPSCPPQFLTMTEDMVMNSLMNNPAVQIAAMMRFLDDMYLMQLRSQLT